MSKKLEFWGVLGTVIYLIVMATTVAFKFESFINLELNALGDFLAGAFGPIAFLWLVLGFLQQGRELKLSSEALQQQAAELAKSVKQQETLVQVAALQIEQIDRSYEADFHLSSHGKDGDKKRDISAEITILNMGAQAREVKLHFDPMFCGDVPSVGALTTAESRTVCIRYAKDFEDTNGKCWLSYVGRDGKSRETAFEYSLSIADDIAVQFERIEVAGKKS